MFHLFAGYTYYPGGGVQDHIGCFASVSAAREYLHDTGYEWYQLADAGLHLVKSGNVADFLSETEEN